MMPYLVNQIQHCHQKLKNIVSSSMFSVVHFWKVENHLMPNMVTYAFDCTDLQLLRPSGCQSLDEKIRADMSS